MPIRTTRQGLRFDGQSDNINYGTSNLLKLTGDLSISAWIAYSYAKNSYASILSNFSNQGGYKGLRFFVDATNKQLGFSIGYGAGMYSNVLSNSGLSIGQLTHVTVVKSGANVSFYINGVLDATKILASDVINAGDILRTGFEPNNAAYFGGTVHTIRYYSRALSMSEVAGNIVRDGLVGEWIANQGEGATLTDTSGNGNHGTIVGAQWNIKKNSKPVRTISNAKPVAWKPKKNLLQDFTKWTRHANAVVDPFNSYKLTLNATAANQYSTFIAPVLPNTTYVCNATKVGEFAIQSLDVTGAIISTVVNNADSLPKSFTTPSNAVSVRVLVYGTIVGTFTFTNPQLELSSTATWFEPYFRVPDVKPVT